jgi:hypothetical protein
VERTLTIHTLCRKPNLELATTVKACKGAGQKGSSGVTFYALGSVRKCEGMNLHTLKCTPILGVGVPMDFWIFKKQL